MRLWLSVHLPLLALETVRPSWSEPGPYAVIEKDQAFMVSNDALRAGVRTGMRVGGIAAISPETVILERQLDREAMALQDIATALLQFTPELAVADDFSLLMDVTASLTFFRGRLAICRRIRASVAMLGFTVQLGAAPTAMGAWLLARSPRQRGQALRRRVVKLTTLSRRLDTLPFALLTSAQPYTDWLTGIGASNLGALNKLPRQGLVRRTAQTMLDDLDKAYGHALELFEWIKVPDVFSARLETFERVEYAEALLFGARRLILQMTGWLVARHNAVSIFSLDLEHERGRAAIPPTVIEIALAEPAWHEEHLILLLKERLANLELIAPVIAIRLHAKKLEAMLPPTESLFPDPGGSPADFKRLLELLSTRLGKENVLVPAAIPDFRPEQCNCWVPALDAVSGTKIDMPGNIERPVWMLEKPIPLLMRNDRPFYSSPLKLIQGPERVEAGWWDDQLAARDYYVAQADDNSCYWIYLERTQNARWHLHGMYA